MPKPERQAAPACELGVTGKRVRRALPAVPPPPDFKLALRARLSALSVQAPPTSTQDRVRSADPGTHGTYGN